jgi:hypothetical protein
VNDYDFRYYIFEELRMLFVLSLARIIQTVLPNTVLVHAGVNDTLNCEARHDDSQDPFDVFKAHPILFYVDLHSCHDENALLDMMDQRLWYNAKICRKSKVNTPKQPQSAHESSVLAN